MLNLLRASTRDQLSRITKLEDAVSNAFRIVVISERCQSETGPLTERSLRLVRPYSDWFNSIRVTEHKNRQSTFFLSTIHKTVLVSPRRDSMNVPEVKIHSAWLSLREKKEQPSIWEVGIVQFPAFMLNTDGIPCDLPSCYWLRNASPCTKQGNNVERLIKGFDWLPANASCKSSI